MLDFICMVLAELLASGDVSEKIKMKLCASAGIEPAIPSFPALRYNQLAIETDNDLLLKF